MEASWRRLGGVSEASWECLRRLWERLGRLAATGSVSGPDKLLWRVPESGRQNNIRLWPSRSRTCGQTCHTSCKTGLSIRISPRLTLGKGTGSFCRVEAMTDDVLTKNGRVTDVGAVVRRFAASSSVSSCLVLSRKPVEWRPRRRCRWWRRPQSSRKLSGLSSLESHVLRIPR